MQPATIMQPDTTGFPLPDGMGGAPPVLAMGAELKSSFCLLGNGQAQLIALDGDLENADVFRRYCIRLEQQLVESGFSPQRIALDMHPDYLSTQMGERLAARHGIGLSRVQHHHAHVAAVLSEHGHPVQAPPVLGIALDGLGYGADGSLWGGEFMLADYAGYRRLGCFAPVAMPGGAQAIRQPWRNSLAHLHACGWETIAGTYADTDIVRFLSDKPLASLQHIITQGVNAPLSSSCGRLFDAVAAALGLCRESISCEGQAAIELESMARAAFSDSLVAYPYSMDEGADGIVHIGWRPMWPALLTDIQGKVPVPLVAARFHRTVASAVAELAMRLCHKHALTTVVLGGGCFHNGLLLQAVTSTLRAGGREVLSACNVPAGDGGLALGQAAVCAARLLKGDSGDD